MRLKIWIIALWIGFMAACSTQESKVYHQFLEVNSNGWGWNDAKAFTFEITDETYFYDVNFELRINSSYLLSNIWLKYNISGPGLKEIGQTEIVVCDNTGKWTGKGQGNLYTYQRQVFANKKLKKGKYTVQIQQNTREEKLAGVSDMGLSVLKSNKAL